MTEAEFAYLRDILHQKSGLSLSPDKRYLVETRLAVLCRRLGLNTLSDLVTRMRGGDQKAIVEVVEVMTTNETLFFRDAQPFKLFSDIMLPALLKARAGERSLRIWSAACSSGQEPYSIAMALEDAAAQLAGWRIEILATDISNEVLEKARQGVYTQFEIQRGLPIQNLLKHFTQNGDKWQVNEKLRRMVTFRHLNLIEPYAGLGNYDVIFCRNVLIYFDLPTKKKVLSMLHGKLRQDGYLLLGSAETVIGVTDQFSVDRENRGLYKPVGPQSAAAAPAAARPAAPPPLAAAAASASPPPFDRERLLAGFGRR